MNTKNNRKPYTRENFIVISGTNKIDPNPDGATFHSVKTVFVHPKYLTAKDNRFHDVGLLELNNEIKLGRRAQLVQLARPTDRPATGADCTVTGYGTNPDHPKDAHSLYQVHLKVIAAEQCAEELADGTVEEVEQHNICAKAEGKNQCKGDSGGMDAQIRKTTFFIRKSFVGPLHDVSTNRQVGIVSYGARDCTADYPSIDCRVTDNLDYIEEIIKQTSGGESDIPPNGSSCTNPAHF